MSYSIAAYLVLFLAVGFLFLLISLLLGRLLRPNAPTAMKLEPYECGEPPVGSAFIQFDLRFYVVALVFIVFEVEVALFFPPAVVFGKTTQLMSYFRGGGELPAQFGAALPTPPTAGGDRASTVVENARQLGLQSGPTDQLASDVRTIALATMVDLVAFFVVILVGFAYVWWRGDLNWVRAIGPSRGEASQLIAQVP